MSIEDYSDIINMSRPVSDKRTPMDRLNRAAQFAPFAALTGYGEAINETGRVVGQKTELSEDRKKEINDNLLYIDKNLTNKSVVCFVYFVKDDKKQGGVYKKHNGTVKKIDIINGFVEFSDGVKISVSDISDVFCNETDTFIDNAFGEI